MSEFNEKDIQNLRESLEKMKPELTHDQYAVMDSITVKVENLAEAGINPNVDMLERVLCWAVMLASVDKIFRLAMNEQYELIDEGLTIFNDAVDYLMEGG